MAEGEGDAKFEKEWLASSFLPPPLAVGRRLEGSPCQLQVRSGTSRLVDFPLLSHLPSKKKKKKKEKLLGPKEQVVERKKNFKTSKL